MDLLIEKCPWTSTEFSPKEIPCNNTTNGAQCASISHHFKNNPWVFLEFWIDDFHNTFLYIWVWNFCCSLLESQLLRSAISSVFITKIRFPRSHHYRLLFYRIWHGSFLITRRSKSDLTCKNTDFEAIRNNFDQWIELLSFGGTVFTCSFAFHDFKGFNFHRLMFSNQQVAEFRWNKTNKIYTI